MSPPVGTSGPANAVPTVASCSDPLVAKTAAAGPEVFVKLKVVVAVTPATEAVTVSAPIVPFAVKVVEVATPLELVVSVSVFVPLAKVPLAPVAGAVKTTNAPATGVEPIVTVATSGAANAVLSAVLCGVPLVAAMDSAGGLKFALLQPANNTNESRTRARRSERRTLA